jgi:hypothetical protein
MNKYNNPLFVTSNNELVVLIQSLCNLKAYPESKLPLSAVGPLLRPYVRFVSDSAQVMCFLSRYNRIYVGSKFLLINQLQRWTGGPLGNGCEQHDLLAVTGLQVGDTQTSRGKISLPSSGQTGKQAISES